MRQIQFDPFGEPVAQDLRAVGRGESRQGPVSRAVMRSGVGLFWVLVIGIVAARVAYFDPDFAEKFGSVAAVTTYIQALFSA
ncbi:hypothetical protein [Methylobacterium oxalidis]|nr:hypothetical protein [Methylobacterium oxalidis]GJE31222.1 hypothetical protein LDDCCGHA_1398 [Methylobacterium oxalidis]